MDTNLELTVPAQFENLTKISEFISQAAGQAHLDDRADYAIQMAVDEACANIIEHAYGGEDGSQTIQLISHLRPDGLEIIIRDYGLSFDLNQPPQFDPQAPLEERPAGGMGLFFIYQLVDHVEFKAGTPNGNQLTLFKRRRQPS
jgi:serine/threonine-protein kinase RsbW